MKIGVIGLGYVGLATMLSFIKKGHDVIGIDKSNNVIDKLLEGTSPIAEPGIEELLKLSREFYTDYIFLKDRDVIFVCVDTPTNDKYESDLSNLNSCIDLLGKNVKDNTVIVIKSTCPVGTTRNLKAKLRARYPQLNVTFAFNPEFLSQGSAIKNALKPNRIVLGVMDEETKTLLTDLYSSFMCPIIITDFESAELSKYVCNSFLATKISFINEMANLADATGANIDDIKKVMSLDPRIGDIFLNPGVGYGGGCFIKDTRSLINQADNKKVKLNVIKGVDETNNKQKNILLKNLYNYLGNFACLREQDILMIGFAFKPNTGDIRGSIAYDNVQNLREYQPIIHVYDPLVDTTAPYLSDIIFEDNLKDAVRKCKYILIYSEKNEALLLDAEDYRNKVIFDGRNLLNKHLIKYAKHYKGVGK